jgi:thermitase
LFQENPFIFQLLPQQHILELYNIDKNPYFRNEIFINFLLYQKENSIFVTNIENSPTGEEGMNANGATAAGIPAGSGTVSSCEDTPSNGSGMHRRTVSKTGNHNYRQQRCFFSVRILVLQNFISGRMPMKRFVSLLSVFLLLAMLVVPATIFASPVQPVSSKYAPGELIVKFKSGTSSAAIQSLHAKMGAKVSKTSKAGFQVVKFSGTSVEAMLQKYKKLPNVEYAEPNYYYHAFWTPNDPAFATQQWGPQKIQAPAAWDVTRGSSSVRVAVVDTGVQANHPDLAGKVVNGWDFVENDGTPQDANGHGTHVAGIAAAVTNNGVGIAGVAPNVQILAVRVLDANGSGTLDAVAAGIQYAADNGAKVINLSLGGSVGSTTLQNAVNYAWNKGVVVVAAAGNSGSSAPSYPAYYTNAIAVASTTSSDTKSSFSNWGSWVDVAAPGSSIYSTYAGSTYATLSGTSMATPHVAGLAGLLASQGRTASQIRAAIQNTADPISGTGTYWTYGRINAYRAVTY